MKEQDIIENTLKRVRREILGNFTESRKVGFYQVESAINKVADELIGKKLDIESISVRNHNRLILKYKPDLVPKRLFITYHELDPNRDFYVITTKTCSVTDIKLAVATHKLTIGEVAAVRRNLQLRQGFWNIGYINYVPIREVEPSRLERSLGKLTVVGIDDNDRVFMYTNGVERCR